MFSLENFRMLVDRSQLPIEKLSVALDIPLSTIRSYLKGACPNIGNLIKIADYFAVPMDYLLGRCSEELVRDITENYSKYFMELRRAPYESYLLGRTVRHFDSHYNGEEPYPYNLVDTINGEPINYTLRPENLEALEQAISTLTEREQMCVKMYFKDAGTLESIANHFSLSKERIAQILRKAIRKLGHPRRKNAIFNGWHSFEEVDDYAKEVEVKAQQLSEAEQKLKEAEADLTAREANLRTVIKQLEKDGYTLPTPEKNEHEPATKTEIEKLDLSVRSYNCLARAELKYIEDVVAAFEKNPEIVRSARNLGQKSYSEILHRLDDYYNTDTFFKKYYN